MIPAQNTHLDASAHSGAAASARGNLVSGQPPAHRFAAAPAVRPPVPAPRPRANPVSGQPPAHPFAAAPARPPTPAVAAPSQTARPLPAPIGPPARGTQLPAPQQQAAAPVARNAQPVPRAAAVAQQPIRPPQRGAQPFAQPLAPPRTPTQTLQQPRATPSRPSPSGLPAEFFPGPSPAGASTSAAVAHDITRLAVDIDGWQPYDPKAFESPVKSREVLVTEEQHIVADP